MAQYALSSFGTCIPVPHPEDSGIDLYCTLGRRVGRRFLVENHYFVQVKSSAGEIKYNGEDEVNWLLSHKYPFLICIVNKSNARIELYQTVAISTLTGKNSIKSITLNITNKGSQKCFPETLNEEDINLYLGEPIVKFSITTFSNKSFKEKISETLKSWIELDQENIDLKETGFTMYRIPEKWKANNPVQALKFIGNFKDSITNTNIRRKFDDLFLKFLSQLVNQAAAESDAHKYNSLIVFIKKYTNSRQISDSFGARILQFCVNEGNKHLGIIENMIFNTKK